MLRASYSSARDWNSSGVKRLAFLLFCAGLALASFAQTISEQDAAAHAQRAKEAERNNDFATAVHEYEYLAGLFPTSAEVQSNLGVALCFHHNFTRAISVFRKAIALNPQLLAPHLFSGIAWYRLSNPDLAVEELTAATRINPSDVLARMWLGYALLAQGESEKAVTELQQANRLDPENVDVWYELGQTYLQIGKEKTERLLAIAPDGARVWQLAGEQALLQGNRQKAREDFEAALERRPDLPDVRAALQGSSRPAHSEHVSRESQEDVLYREAHQAEQAAEAAFERVAQLAPDSYRAHQIMGDSLTAQQRFEEADEEYRTVLKLNKDVAGVHQAIGINLLRRGKAAEALSEFQAELQIQPQSAAVHMHLAQALLPLGRDNEARKLLNSALQMDRPPIEIYRLLAKLDLRRKDYTSTIKALNHYVSIRKDDASAYYLLSRAYSSVGDKQQSEHALALFQSTSRDAKARTQARRELESMSRPAQIPDFEP